MFRGLTLKGDIMVSKLKPKSSHKEDEEIDNKLELLLVNGTWSVNEEMSSVEDPWTHQGILHGPSIMNNITSLQN